ncbi:hypothetical protein DFH09DRAFT_1096639 [Mycena vulgaris]|nr:hypothetical protein DFH09DRAFT_1096639 [Mycena vulgaris]
MLGFNYGTPTVYSWYDYSTYDIGAPQDLNGNTSPVTCFESGWRCEQEWIAIANMTRLHRFPRNQQRGKHLDQDVHDLAPRRHLHGTDTASNTCSGPSYIVSSSGQFTASIAMYDALALFSGFS